MSEFIEFQNSQINEWIKAAENIEGALGLEQALGYLIGEKFYHMIKYKNLFLEQCDLDTYNQLLRGFSEKIQDSFSRGEISIYFNSNPRFGPLGHVASEEAHRVLVEEGAVEHSMDTEVEDALILGEMRELLCVE